jgi:hypothetical protein
VIHVHIGQAHHPHRGRLDNRDRAAGRVDHNLAQPGVRQRLVPVLVVRDAVAEWRAGHERFWHSAEMRQALGDPMFTVGDDTLVVAQEFRLIQD